MEFDEILVKHVGVMGKFQMIYIFSLIFYSLAIFSPMMELIFQGIRATHICSTPELDQLALRLNLSFDDVLAVSAPPGEREERQQCHVIVRDYVNMTEDMIRALINASTWVVPEESDGDEDQGAPLEPCSAWKYDRTEHGRLLAEYFDLVCDKEWMLAQSQTFNMAGMLAGIFIFGWLGDRVGRKPAMLSSLGLVVVARVGSVLAPWYALFVMSGVLCLATSMGFFTQGYLMGIEMVGTRWRSTTGLLSLLGFSLVNASCAAIAYLMKDFRWTMLADSAFIVPYFLYFFLLSESARWLFATGRVEKGRRVLERMARVNKTTLPAEYEIFREEKKDDANPLKLFKTPEMRKRTLVNSALWFVVSLVNYGIVFNSVNLSGSIYLNVLLYGVTIVAAWVHTQFSLEVSWLGRRKNLFITMVFSGICLLAMLLVPESLGWMSITLYMLGKTSVAASFNVVYVHTPETMPTELRSTGMSVASTCARVGGIIAPYIAFIGRGNKLLPSVVMGGLSILVAGLVFLLPETLGCRLPDTVTQVEASREKQPHSKDKPAMVLSTIEAQSNGVQT